MKRVGFDGTTVELKLLNKQEVFGTFCSNEYNDTNSDFQLNHRSLYPIQKRSKSMT